MERRRFLTFLATLGATAPFARVQASEEAGTCLGVSREGLAGISLEYAEIRHQHELIIPIEVLVNPPAKGYTARSSAPIAGRSDLRGLANRKNEDGSPLDLSEHSHSVTLSQKELRLLASGFHVTVPMPKVHHKFYFSADDETLEQIRLRKS